MYQLLFNGYKIWLTGLIIREIRQARLVPRAAFALNRICTFLPVSNSRSEIL